MPQSNNQDPALILALYASTAATTAVMALRKEQLIGSDSLNILIGSLNSSKAALAGDAKALAHADFLISLLDRANAQSE